MMLSWAKAKDGGYNYNSKAVSKAIQAACILFFL